MASVARYCCCGGDEDPCTDCDPGGVGSAPNSATVTNVAGDPGCAALNESAPYDAFSNTTNFCVWTWVGDAVIVAVAYCKSSATRLGVYDPACDLAMVTGEWSVTIFPLALNGSEWHEKTTGFACAGSPSKIAGTHTFASECSDDGCNGTPTVTIPA